MNSRERFLATMNFDSVDRVLLWEFGYWAGTLRRWYGEGLPVCGANLIMSDLLEENG